MGSSDFSAGFSAGFSTSAGADALGFVATPPVVSVAAPASAALQPPTTRAIRAPPPISRLRSVCFFFGGWGCTKGLVGSGWPCGPCG